MKIKYRNRFKFVEPKESDWFEHTVNPEFASLMKNGEGFYKGQTLEESIIQYCSGYPTNIRMGYSESFIGFDFEIIDE